MISTLLVLLVGLLTLVVAGDFLVKGAVGLAQNFAISPLIIGLTIVAFGTSAPELVVSVRAALAGSGGISVGNVVGSNIANIFLVLGLPSLVAVTQCGSKGEMRSAISMIAISVLFVAMLETGSIGRLGGLVLLFVLSLFLFDQYRYAREDNGAEQELLEDFEDAPQNSGLLLVFLIIGLIGLPFGAHYTVESAVSIAKVLNVSDEVIGLSIVAIGTSLPELATAFIAAYRGSSSVAIGNIIGSNLFNVAAIMGITTVIAPVTVPLHLIRIDVWVMLGGSLMLIFFIHRRVAIGKLTGMVLTGFYAAYMIHLFL